MCSLEKHIPKNLGYKQENCKNKRHFDLQGHEHSQTQEKKSLVNRIKIINFDFFWLNVTHIIQTR